VKDTGGFSYTSFYAYADQCEVLFLLPLLREKCQFSSFLARWINSQINTLFEKNRRTGPWQWCSSWVGYCRGCKWTRKVLICRKFRRNPWTFWQNPLRFGHRIFDTFICYWVINDSDWIKKYKVWKSNVQHFLEKHIFLPPETRKIFMFWSSWELIMSSIPSLNYGNSVSQCYRKFDVGSLAQINFLAMFGKIRAKYFLIFCNPEHLPAPPPRPSVYIRGLQICLS